MDNSIPNTASAQEGLFEVMMGLDADTLAALLAGTTWLLIFALVTWALICYARRLNAREAALEAEADVLAFAATMAIPDSRGVLYYPYARDGRPALMGRDGEFLGYPMENAS